MRSLAELDVRINAILPPRYEHCYSDVQPNSMGSASLRYGRDGKVVWDEIWSSFCDLAIAGGPPHRGRWLQPLQGRIAAQDAVKYQGVIDELSRAIDLVTSLPVTTEIPGWIGVTCDSITMAGWLTCAIVAENVAAYRDEATIFLPAGPDFRVEKEIKNVVTALAKTCHYWAAHGPVRQEQSVFAELLNPISFSRSVMSEPEYQAAVAALQEAIHQKIDWPTDGTRYYGWVGVSCPTVETAIWLLRVLIVSGILVRREEAVLYLPVGNGEADVVQVAKALIDAWQLWQHQQHEAI